MGVSGNIVGLMLSNLAIFPALFLASKRKLLPEASILTAVSFISIVYHTCQVNVWCVAPLDSLQESDHLMVFSALTYFTLFFWDVRPSHKIAILFLVYIFLFPVILAALHTWLPTLVSITAALLVSVAVLSWFGFSAFRVDFVDLVVACVLFGIGIAFFVLAGDPSTTGAYPLYHSLWHVAAFLALFFVIELKTGSSRLSKWVRSLRTETRMDFSYLALIEERGENTAELRHLSRKIGHTLL